MDLRRRQLNRVTATPCKLLQQQRLLRLARKLTALVLHFQVRRYLHVVLCFSPVGDKFRIRARQFPALVNCTQLDWFHGWPAEALLSVATRFLADIPDVADDVRVSMAQYMAQAHQVCHCVRSFSWTTVLSAGRFPWPCCCCRACPAKACTCRLANVDTTVWQLL